MPHRFPETAIEAAAELYREIAVAALDDATVSMRAGALARAIPEAMPDAVLAVSETGEIVSVNVQCELMFGYHRSELLGQTPEILMPEGVRERHVAHRARYAETPRVRDMGENLHLIARRKTGSEFAGPVRLGPVVIPEGIYTIVVIRRRPAPD